MENLDYQTIITKLGLTPLPQEGGFYRETYRSDKKVLSNHLGKMDEYTCIYYLITSADFSALHRVDQDEIFHFYAGDPVEMIQIQSNGRMEKNVMGRDIMMDQKLQYRVSRDAWQGARILNPKTHSWALLGCSVSPGFEFKNFHIKSRSELTQMFPNLESEIRNFTHPS